MNIFLNFTILAQGLRRFIKESKRDVLIILFSLLLLFSSFFTSSLSLNVPRYISIILILILVLLLIPNFSPGLVFVKKITYKIALFSLFNFFSFLYSSLFYLFSFLFLILFFDLPYFLIFFSLFPFYIILKNFKDVFFVYPIYVILLFVISYREKKRMEKLKEEMEKISSKLRLFDIERVPREKVLKELKSPLYPEKPAPLFKFALNHLKEVYKDIIFPNSLAFLFYDPVLEGFRIEVSFSKRKSFKEKGVIPLYSPLIRLATQRNERIYFPEFAGSVYDAGFYDSDVKIGSLCLVPIYSDRDLYGFIYTDKEEIRGFSESDLKFLDYLSKEISLYLKFFISLKDEHLLASRFRGLFELTKETSGKLRLKEVAERIIHVAELLKSSDFICLFEKRGEEIICVAINKEREWIREGSRFVHSEDSIISLLFKSGFPVFTGRIKSSVPVIGRINPDVKSLLAFPIRVEGKLSYTLALFSKYPDFYDEKDREIFGFLTQQAQVSLEKALLFERTLEMAIRDSLTGLYNHRTFQEKLSGYVKRSMPFALLLMDVDHFKRINDKYGHPFGDKVLIRISEILKDESEKGGISARYGGEEFALIIEGSKEYAQYRAEEIRRKVEKEEFYTDEGERVLVTMSIGLASFPADARERSVLIERADRALYIAKRSGRNRVVAWAQEEMGLF